MEKIGITDTKEFFCRITNVENPLFEQLETMKENIQYNKFNKRGHQKFQDKPEKFCHFHLTKTHSSEECNALKQKREKKVERKLIKTA